MLKLPGWMRVVMLVTAVVNILGSFAFIPSARALREIDLEHVRSNGYSFQIRIPFLGSDPIILRPQARLPYGGS